MGRRLLAIALLSLSWGCTRPNLHATRTAVRDGQLNSAFPDTFPALSGDGRYIVFSSVRSGTESIYLYDTQTRQLVDLPRLNANNVANTQPDISADGRWIVYLSNALGKSEVFLYDRTTAEIQNISLSIPGDVRHPRISANGRWIVFESNGLGQWHIEVFDRGEAVLTQPSPTPSP
jgi:Tol biopolymer transport system component